VYATTFVAVRHNLQFVAEFVVIIVLVASAGYHARRPDALACLAVGLAIVAMLILLEPQLGGPRLPAE
jgi:glycerol uptake facilitator-like aquaporin